MGTIYHVFCDESRIVQDQFMVFGGIIAPARSVVSFNERLKQFRDKFGLTAELKWTKVSRAKLPEYKEFINEFFRVCRRDVVHFRSVVFDTHQFDYARFHQGDKDLGFYKFFYQFVLHSFCKYAVSDDDRLLMFFDERRSKTPLSDLKRSLNSGSRKKHGRLCDVVASIEPICSHESDILQVADVMMGAVGYHQNGRHLNPEASQSKIALANHIAKLARLQSLKQQTPWGSSHFGIWPFRFNAQ